MASYPSPSPVPASSTDDPPSPLQGLWNIFFSPGEAFTGGKRAWLIPLLATVLLVTVSSALLVTVVGLETLTRAQLESNPRIADQLGPDGIDTAARDAGRSQVRKILSYVMPPVAVVLVMMAVSAILLGLFLMSGAATTFGSVFTATAWSWYATSLIALLLSAVVLLSAPDYEGLDFQNLVALNPTMFIDRGSVPGALYAVLSSLDLLTFYGIALLAFGVSKLSRGLSFGKSAAVVVVGWLLWVAAKAGFSALF